MLMIAYIVFAQLTNLFRSALKISYYFCSFLISAFNNKFFSPTFSTGQLNSREIYLKAGYLIYVMTKCLFCGAYCEVKCGAYCEGYSGDPENKNSEDTRRALKCAQIGTSYVCDNCLKDLKEALDLVNLS